MILGLLYHRIWSSDPGNGREVGINQTEICIADFVSSKSADGEGVGFEASIPNLFTREQGTSNTVSKTRDFFTQQRGTIVVSEALCLTHRVDIRKKQFGTNKFT